HRGLRCLEMPIYYGERIGTSKLNIWRDGFGNLFFLVRMRLVLGRRRRAAVVMPLPRPAEAAADPPVRAPAPRPSCGMALAHVAPPSGGRFLWPLSGAYYIAPRPLLDEVIINSSSRGAFVASVLTPHALGVWGRELACLVGIVGLVHGLRRSAPAAEVPEAS